MKIVDKDSDATRRAGRAIHGSWRVPAGAASLLLTVSVVAMVAGSARADCSPAGTAGADAVTCDSTGADNTPYSSDAGDDTIDIISGTFADSISGGDDNDVLTLDGGTAIGDILGGNGNDTITLDGTSVGSGILGNDGDDSINLLSGGGGFIDGGAGQDTITLNGAAVTGVFGGTNDDAIGLLSGTAVSVHGNAGNDVITLGGATVSAGIFGAAGDDTINLLSGTVTVAVAGDDGTDTIVLNGATVDGDIFGNADSDTINLLAGAVSDDVFGGAGSDAITLNGATATIGDDLFGGSGNDTVTLFAGTLTDDLFGGSGNDIISILGATVGGDVFGQSGNDVITLNGGSVAGKLDGSSGDDSFALVTGTLGGDLLGDGGSDVATITSSFDLSTIAGNLDGGDDTAVADGFVDVLNIQTGGTLAGSQVLNWERINLSPDTPLTLTGTVATSSDPGQGMSLNTGTLAITSLDITGNFTNSSLVDMTGNAATGDMLTLSNDYTGGGTLALDAALDATLASDQMVIDGEIGGTTTLSVTDLGGDPTLTGTGPGNGIPLVDNSIGGDLADGDFVLPGGEIVKSPFTYTLSAESDDILYLQSSVLGQVYGYAILHEFMREEFPILRDRLGDRRYLGIDSGEPELTFDHNAGLWVRLDGRRREIDNDDGDAFTTSEWDQTRGEFELGIDIPAFGGSVGVFSFGIHGVKSTADATGPGSSDTAELDGYGFGANLGLTYFPGGGFYADLQGRVTAWKTDVEVDSRGLDEDADAISWGTSLEVGNRMKLGESTMLIPRGRAVYTDVRLDEFTDSDGVSVDSEDGDSLTLEAGMALETVFRGSGLSLFADASVSHDVLGDSSVTASGMEFESGLEDTWGKVALGVTVPVAEGTAAFAKADVSTPLGGTFTDSYGYGVQLGVRMDF